MLSFGSLKTFWKMCHSTLNYKRLSNHKLQIEKCKGDNKETCKIYEEFSKVSNCSDLRGCQNFHELTLQLKPKKLRDIVYSNQKVVFPMGQRDNQYTFQILVEKINVFDSNLTAFVSPFTAEIWLSINLAVVLITAWLIFLEKEPTSKIVFWQFSTVLDEDITKFNQPGCGGKIIIIFWTFALILLRQFYNKSFYSLLVTERGPKNIPGSFREMLE